MIMQPIESYKQLSAYCKLSKYKDYRKIHSATRPFLNPQTYSNSYKNFLVLRAHSSQTAQVWNAAVCNNMNPAIRRDAYSCTYRYSGLNFEESLASSNAGATVKAEVIR